VISHSGIGSKKTADATPRQLDSVTKDKLKYEWKNIYRQINANDVEQNGKVKLCEFNTVLKQTNTFLSRQEIRSIKS
jgi:hypothetical protein